MEFLDYIVVALFFVLMVIIGFASFKKVTSSGDFFVGGGKVPWWLAGISHHVSGYSGVVFVGYAAIAYENGFTIYVWWACSIAIACFIGAFTFAPRWSKLRKALHIESPTEYLATRYNVPAQQLMAWSGVILKLFDVGAKWASIGILLYGFTGLPISVGILLSGIVSLLYITIGGLWADLYTDLAQFIVQFLAGIVLFVAVMMHLGGTGSLMGIWHDLPEGHSNLFNGPYTGLFFIAVLGVNFLSYNGGTWNLAARYISSPSGKSATKAALLSGVLYVFWPLVLFFPMWAAPLLDLPGMEHPSESYAILVQQFLPAGLVGLVLAGMFANTMSMTTSDANTVSAVISRDILPRMFKRFQNLSQAQGLLLARIATFVFTLLTLVIALENQRFGGVLGLIISWFLALVGAVSVPMMLGLLPVFKHADSKTAIGSILGGLVAFILTKMVFSVSLAVETGAPLFTAAFIFILASLLRRGKPVPAEVEELMEALAQPDEEDLPEVTKMIG